MKNYGKYTMYQKFWYNLAHAQTVCTRPSLFSQGLGTRLEQRLQDRQVSERPLKTPARKHDKPGRTSVQLVKVLISQAGKGLVR